MGWAMPRRVNWLPAGSAPRRTSLAKRLPVKGLNTSPSLAAVASAYASSARSRSTAVRAGVRGL